MAPKRAPEASRSYFGTNLGAKMEPRGFIFEAFLAKRWPRNAWLTKVVGGVGEAIVNKIYPAAHWPRRCEITPRSTQWSFKLREAKL